MCVYVCTCKYVHMCVEKGAVWLGIILWISSMKCMFVYVCMYVKYVRIRCVRMQVPYVCKCSMYIRT